MDSSNLNYFLKALSPETVTMGVRVSTYERAVAQGVMTTRSSPEQSLSASTHCEAKFPWGDSDRGSLSRVQNRVEGTVASLGPGCCLVQGK